MSGDHVVTVCRADPIGDQVVPGRCIDITEPMPQFHPDAYVADARAFHLRQAELIHGALIASLPGGTLDALFALQAADRASILRLNPAAQPARQPTPEAATPVLDMGWRQGRRQPQNLYSYGRYVGVMFHPDDATLVCAVMSGHPAGDDDDVVDAEIIGWPEQVAALEAQRAAVLAIHFPVGSAQPGEADCVQCTIPDADLYVSWPCPTAQALGVTA